MSYTFTATGDKIDGTFASTVDPDTFTMAFWIKRTQAQWDATSGNSNLIVHLANNTSGTQDSVYVRNGNTVQHRLRACTRITSGTERSDIFTITDTAIIDDGNWALVTAVFNTDSSRELFINGVGSGTPDTNTAASLNCDIISIGGPSNSTASADAIIAEVCFWNTPLSDSQVASLYTSSETGPVPSSILPNNVIGYWPLNQDYGATAGAVTNEATGTAKIAGDLTVQSAAPYNIDHPTITSGTNETVYPFTGPWR